MIHVRRECRGWVGKPVDEERRERPKSEATARRTTEKSPLPRTVTNLRAPKRADPRRRRSAHAATRDPQDQQQPPPGLLSKALTRSTSPFRCRTSTATLGLLIKSTHKQHVHFWIPTSCTSFLLRGCHAGGGRRERSQGARPFLVLCVRAFWWTMARTLTPRAVKMGDGEKIGRLQKGAKSGVPPPRRHRKIKIFPAGLRAAARLALARRLRRRGNNPCHQP